MLVIVVKQHAGVSVPCVVCLHNKVGVLPRSSEEEAGALLSPVNPIKTGIHPPVPQKGRYKKAFWWSVSQPVASPKKIRDTISDEIQPLLL